MAELLLCWRVAEKADKIAAALYRIRSEVDVAYVQELAIVTRQVHLTSRLLRDIFDLSPIYLERVRFVQEYLSIIFPCLRRTLEDIWYRLGDPDHSLQRVWIDLYEDLTEQGDIRLEERFVLYNDFLVQLVRLLSRSDAPLSCDWWMPNRVSRPSLFNAPALESLRIRILHLRIRRGMPGTPS